MASTIDHLDTVLRITAVASLSLVTFGCISFLSGDSIDIANQALAINNEIQQTGMDNGVVVGLYPETRTQVETILVDAQEAANEVEILKQQAEDVLDENFEREDRHLMIQGTADAINNIAMASRQTD